MAKKAHKPKKGKKDKVKKKPKAKSFVQEQLEKIAHKHKSKEHKKEKKKIKVKEEQAPIPRTRLTTIPEDLRIAVKLTMNQYGTGIDFSNFRYRDLQRACIIRGLPPEELVEGDIIRLHKWLNENKDKPVQADLLDKFDEWREKILSQKHGTGEPFLRLGYIGKLDEQGEPVMVYKPKAKKPKKHIEKDNEMGGLWKGTKKHLTMQCKKDGLSLEKTFKKVLAAFPDAKESSVKIWFKRS